MENTDFNLTAFIDITDQEISHLEKLIELENQKLHSLKLLKQRLKQGIRSEVLGNISQEVFLENVKIDFNWKDRIAVNSTSKAVKFITVNQPTSSKSVGVLQFFIVIDDQGCLKLSNLLGYEFASFCLDPKIYNNSFPTSLQYDSTNVDTPLLSLTYSNGAVCLLSLQVYWNDLLVAGVPLKNSEEYEQLHNESWSAFVPSRTPVNRTIHGRRSYSLPQTALIRGKVRLLDYFVLEAKIAPQSNVGPSSAFVTSSYIFYDVNKKKHLLYYGDSRGRLVQYDIQTRMVLRYQYLSQNSHPILSIVRSAQYLLAACDNQIHKLQLMRLVPFTEKCSTSSHSRIIKLVTSPIYNHLVYGFVHDQHSHINTLQAFNYHYFNKENKETQCSLLQTYQLSNEWKPEPHHNPLWMDSNTKPKSNDDNNVMVDPLETFGNNPDIVNTTESTVSVDSDFSCINAIPDNLELKAWKRGIFLFDSSGRLSILNASSPSSLTLVTSHIVFNQSQHDFLPKFDYLVHSTNGMDAMDHELSFFFYRFEELQSSLANSSSSSSNVDPNRDSVAAINVYPQYLDRYELNGADYVYRSSLENSWLRYLLKMPTLIIIGVMVILWNLFKNWTKGSTTVPSTSAARRMNRLERNRAAMASKDMKLHAKEEIMSHIHDLRNNRE